MVNWWFRAQWSPNQKKRWLNQPNWETQEFLGQQSSIKKVGRLGPNPYPTKIHGTIFSYLPTWKPRIFSMRKIYVKCIDINIPVSWILWYIIMPSNYIYTYIYCPLFLLCIYVYMLGNFGRGSFSFSVLFSKQNDSGPREMWRHRWMLRVCPNLMTRMAFRGSEPRNEWTMTVLGPSKLVSTHAHHK